jgi:hypothetical protein
MLAWLLTSWPSQIAVVVFAVWFLRGLWVATQRPRLKYVSHSDVEHRNWLVTVERQQLLPPWTKVTETWLVTEEYDGATAVREGDGYRVAHRDRVSLARELLGVVCVARARDKETERLTKEESRHAN